MRKLITATTLALALVLTGCASLGTSEPSEPPTPPSTAPEVGFPADAVIGVSFPQKTIAAWSLPEIFFNDGLKDAGFKPKVVFADAGGVQQQQEQIQSMIDAGAKVIIVSPIDGSRLGEQLASAKQAGITVIAYERLLTGTPDVDMYIAYDNCQVGTVQGTALLEGLAKKGPGPYNIELIAGASEDGSSLVFFNCAMEVLQPKIDDGTLRIPSGQTTMQQVRTEGWLAANAQIRIETILSDFYSDGTKLNGILSPNDTLARAAITALEDASLPIPVVTGQDAEEESIRLIAEGRQHSTVFLDDFTLVTQTISLVKQLQQGQEITFNDTTTFDNGVKVVPAQMLAPMLITQDNICTALDLYSAAGRAAAETPLCKGE